MKKAILLFFLAFVSCDEYANYSLFVDNKTNTTVEIVFTEGSPYYHVPLELLIVPPNSKILFYSQTGNRAAKGCMIGIREEEVEVYISSGQQLTKKIWIADNWECSGNNKVGWKQTFVITNDDLE